MRSNDAFRLSVALGDGWTRDSLTRNAGCEPVNMGFTFRVTHASERLRTINLVKAYNARCGVMYLTTRPL